MLGLNSSLIELAEAYSTTLSLIRKLKAADMNGKLPFGSIEEYLNYIGDPSEKIMSHYSFDEESAAELNKLVHIFIQRDLGEENSSERSIDVRLLILHGTNTVVNNLTHDQVRSVDCEARP